MKRRTASAAGAAAGDAELAELLRQEGAPYDPAGLRALIAGVVAAPPDRDPAAWTTLVVAAPSPALRQRLLALADELRAGPCGAGAAGRAAEAAACRAQAPRRRRLSRAARRRASGRIRAAPRRSASPGSPASPARPGSRSCCATARRCLRRWPLHAAGGRRRSTARSVRDPSPDRGAGRRTGSPRRCDKGEVLGYDPWLHTPDEVERFRAAAEKAGGEPARVRRQPARRGVDRTSRRAPLAPVVPHPTRFAGESAEAKRPGSRRELATRRGSRRPC